MTTSIITLPALPGTWQLWGPTTESGYSWVVPADPAAQAYLQAARDGANFMPVADTIIAAQLTSGTLPPPLF